MHPVRLLRREPAIPRSAAGSNGQLAQPGRPCEMRIAAARFPDARGGSRYVSATALLARPSAPDDGRGLPARAWAARDVSPPCSGHDGLTPGLGDRNVGRRPDSERRAAVAEAQESGRDDAPSNGNPDPLPPGSEVIPRDDNGRLGRLQSRSGCATDFPYVPDPIRPMRSWPPGRRHQVGAESLRPLGLRQGVLRSHMRGVTNLSQRCQ